MNAFWKFSNQNAKDFVDQQSAIPIYFQLQSKLFDLLKSQIFNWNADLNQTFLLLLW